MNTLVFIKIGGSLITDKEKPFTVRTDMLLKSAQGIRRAMDQFPSYSFVIGNGAGSFGHYLAAQEILTENNASQLRISSIHESVTRLNNLLVQEMNSVGVPAFSVSPSACITCNKGLVTASNFTSIEALLEQRYVPSIYGDIYPDTTEKGMIISTESLLELLIEDAVTRFDDIRVIYVGEVSGVHDTNNSIIPEISVESWKSQEMVIDATKGFDVTGGMRHKVESALRATRYSNSVHIISGTDAQNIVTALSGGHIGTKVVA